MRVRFIGNPARDKNGEPVDNATSVAMFGKTFALDAEVDVSDLLEAQQKKLAAHNHFEIVDGEASSPSPLRRRRRTELESNAENQG